MISRNFLIFFLLFFKKAYFNADNHKIVTFFGGMTLFNNSLSKIGNNYYDYNEEIDIFVPMSKINNNLDVDIDRIHYKSKLSVDSLTKEKTYMPIYRGGPTKNVYYPSVCEQYDDKKKLEPPSFNNVFKAIMFNYSFDEVANNIYAGLAFLYGTIESKHTLESQENSLIFYAKREIPASIGGYAQLQNGENEDYSFFIKFSALLTAEYFGLLTINRNIIINDRIQLNQNINDKIKLGALLLLQIGGKFDFLEVSITFGFNWIPEFKYKHKNSSGQIKNNILFVAIGIGFLFK